MRPSPQGRRRIPLALSGALLIAAVVAACVSTTSPEAVPLHGWWRGLGPVVPHDDFPADCRLCHVGTKWQTLRPDFQYDHATETGVALHGAHAQARCLRCHNDRGPVSVFTAQGCAGCHEDLHLGQLGPDCRACHEETTWRPVGQFELHNRTRFPLVGVHAATACHRCHLGADVGRFTPTSSECVSCHQTDLARAINPNHVLLGWVDHCNRCHMPVTWEAAEIDPTTGGAAPLKLPALGAR